MNKKIVLTLIITLSIMFIATPVMAAPATKTSYTATVTLSISGPGVTWVTEGGITLIKGQEYMGLFTSTDPSLTGIMVKVCDIMINENTGTGTIHGTFILTPNGGAGTLEGTFRGRITDNTHLAGTVVGQGTGDFEGSVTRGTWEGDMVLGSQMINVLDATLLSPRG
jgi:hypothetical protein